MKLGPDFQVFKLDVCELGLKVLVWLYRTEQYVYWLDQIQIWSSYIYRLQTCLHESEKCGNTNQKKNKKETNKKDI